MTDSVTSSAVATGDVAAVKAREKALAPLFGGDKALAGADADLQRALDEVADTPTIGAIAAVEMARIASGWSVEIGAKNGLAKYETFAARLVADGWFLEGKKAAAMALPSFNADDPVRSIKTIVADAYPDLSDDDRLKVCRALVRSLGHTLGPGGIAPEPAGTDPDLLGKPEVLERRVTTVASSVLKSGDAPSYAMNWRTETFLRTKDGKDDPKSRTDVDTKNHRLRFNLDRWQSGDRSALLDYYRYVEEWLSDFNSSTGPMKSMACFDPILDR